ncbi:protein of unknown function [Magnetospirillum sp. XM-1]|uniref:HAD domain-containing protein n=1 Tax=Magnetospirillum sp. XM-1 TaxID=1663591 RepID=UPI00073DD5A3|nr:HAD domain-containing protein [Magnetospirillum sp. XM-1]CUW38655.1 protein of unknown function [Magnetospirillum sp. XM-1]
MTAAVVFLDIDDVLLPAGADRFDQAAVEWVNKLVRDAQADIVVHSSWRRHLGAEETIRELIAQGITKPFCCLPEQSEFSIKAEDVAAWLKDHVDVKAWVLLDDDPAVCRSIRALKDSRGLAIQVSATNRFDASGYKHALRHFGKVFCL